MKIRYGFVSNSSSSSFIIAFKGSKYKMRKKLSDVFGIMPSNNYPIKSMLPIGDIVADKVDISIKTLNEWEEFYGNSDDSDENHARYIERLKEGWTIYIGKLGDCHNKFYTFLSKSDIDYEDDEIIIWQKGGY